MSNNSKRLILDNLIKEYSDCIKKVTADEDDPVSYTVTKEDINRSLKFIGEFYKYYPYSLYPCSSNQKTLDDFDH